MRYNEYFTNVVKDWELHAIKKMNFVGHLLAFHVGINLYYQEFRGCKIRFMIYTIKI